ncbi:unnamed protein product [Brugia timori]|uniref:Uncharacterized protein n=1 Tax=Brugia timori TaxID=42155 RepID=A0A3P7TZJ1_9BILA|nr:unnamed protein product [Brugia timori]
MQPGIPGMPGKDAIYCPCPLHPQKAPPAPPSQYEPQKAEEPQSGYKQKKKMHKK